MTLFRNRTVVLAVRSSLVLGLVMFGGTVFLGQYFQVARGYAPTEAGLLTLPLVVGLTLASTVSGQLISRYGRWKGFLVVGAVLSTAGLTLLSTMDHTTAIPQICVYLGVLGLGIGMTMQNLVLAVQNTVDVRDVGAASSLVSFLRSMGGTIGVTVLGVVLSSRVSTLLGLPAGSTAGTGDLSSLDSASGVAVRAAYGDAIGLVFGIAAVAALLTLASVVFIKEVPLRTTVAQQPEQATDPATPALVAAATVPTATVSTPAVSGPPPLMSSRPGSAPVKQTVSPGFAAGRLPPLAWTVHFDVTWRRPGCARPCWRGMRPCCSWCAGRGTARPRWAGARGGCTGGARPGSPSGRSTGC